MSTSRTYGDACGIARALDILGERWALMTVRELLLGPKRFTDLRAGLPHASPNILSMRLRDLEEHGIVRKRKLPPPAASQVYELTEWGYESEPIFQALGRWAARSPSHNPALPFSAASFFLSLRTMLDAERAKGVAGRIGFCLGEETFLAHLADGKIEIARGSIEGADLVLTGTPPVLAGAIYGGQPLEVLEQAGVLQVEGDRALAKTFTGLFPLPAKASLT